MLDIALSDIATYPLNSSSGDAEHQIEALVDANAVIILNNVEILDERVSLWLLYRELYLSFSRSMLLGENRYIQFGDEPVLFVDFDFENTCFLLESNVEPNVMHTCTLRNISDTMTGLRSSLESAFLNLRGSLHAWFERTQDPVLFELLSVIRSPGIR